MSEVVEKGTKYKWVTGHKGHIKPHILRTIRLGLIYEDKTATALLKDLNLSQSIWSDWMTNNYPINADRTIGFREFVDDCRRKNLLYKAEQFSKKLMSFKDEEIDEKTHKKIVDKDIVRIKQKEAEFLRSTIGKDFYSKKEEVESNITVDQGVIHLPLKDIQEVKNDDLLESPTETSTSTEE